MVRPMQEVEHAPEYCELACATLKWSDVVQNSLLS